ncbi:ABC transporter permease [Demequina sediminicola]|uniref:ABC transporter permease n=1 Tax=Demequina sediminicola TaxID=1095026 RepID=UPI000783D685|nr:ABC transporter permease [Demequina sediminicola]
MSMPRWMLPLAIAAVALVIVPLAAMALEVPWRDLPMLLTSSASLEALWLSMRTALTATVLCVLLGFPLGYALASWESRWQPLARAIVLAPLVLPPVVGGLALLYAFGRGGLLGQPLDAIGIDIAYTSTAVVIAQTFVAMPFMVLSTESALRSRSGHHELIAATLGSSRSHTFWHITAPAVLPALATGTVLAFARALGEFGATLTFAGSLEGVTRTLPLEIYLQRESDSAVAVALAIVLVAVAIAVVALAYRPPLRSAR